MSQLIEQQTKAPTRKMQGAAAAGLSLGTSLAPLLFWGIESAFKLDAPTTVVASGSAFLGTAMSLIGGYMTRERA